MDHPFHYVGCFFKADEFLKKIAPYRSVPLARTIAHPHVTFIYKPDEVDRSLFGTDIQVTIIGYGNNGMNEGAAITLNSETAELQRMINAIEIPHITISVAEGARSVNTKDLDFGEIPKIVISGKYGGFTKSGRVVLTRGSKHT